MTTSILTPALKLRPQDRGRRRVPRFTPPPLAPGLPSQRPVAREIALPRPAAQPWVQVALSLLRDVLLATLVTLVFLSPFLYFLAPPFTWQWTLGVGLGVVALTIFARFRNQE